MGKEPKRKPRKIHHPRQRDVIDDDLKELAVALDEHRLERNASDWFAVSWHDGWNAVGLAKASFEVNFDEYASPREANIDKDLTEFLHTRNKSAEVYWRAGNYLEHIDREDVSPLLYAALRCLQVLISNSDGGGVVYNDILRRAFEKTEMPAHLFEDTILEYRCRDALGSTAVLQSDKGDRQRLAFSIAWRRGLFHVAYSLRRIS